MVQEIDAAIHGNMPRGLVSYGRFLGIEFPLLVQRKRGSEEEMLNLRAVYGPCDSDKPVAYVFRVGPPF